MGAVRAGVRLAFDDRITNRPLDPYGCANLSRSLGIVGYRMALKQLQLMVRGRVQGVYFRASTQREARRLGLTGWVKNRADGSVEILAEGEEVSIRELYGWAQKGPGAARVDRVETRWRSFTGEFGDFRIVD
jgi:acylphosphatase